jgi:dethiobiotin synthetase
MTADPPEATPRPRLTLVPPPPRPERGSGGHGLPVPAPAPARIAAVPDPLQAHGGGHRLPRPVPVVVPRGAVTEPDDGFGARPYDGPEASAGTAGRLSRDGAATEPRGDRGFWRHDDRGMRQNAGPEAAPRDDHGIRRDDGLETESRDDGEAWRSGGTGAESHDDAARPWAGAGREDGAEAEPDAVPEAGDASSDDAGAPSAVPLPEETVTDDEPEADRAPEETEKAPEASNPHEWHGIVLVTGTDTEVGKTIATAAMAAAAQAAGLRVAVIKPGQTGIATGAPTDADVVTRLAGPDTVRTLAEYPEPLAPLAAAKVAGLPPLDLYDVVDAIRAEATKHDLVLVEGAGGLLVPMGLRPSGEAWTFADLATTLGSGTIVVSRAGLGTLNHTALTLEALNRRGVHAKVILGAWPAEPELVHWANLGELVPHLVGALPAGAGSMDPGVFRRSAPGWLTPALHGVLDNWRVWAEEAG